ncbi:hypothetical protein [Streptomyces sp. NPDC002403]
MLVADADAGHTWRTLATLPEPGLETHQGIGNASVTGSGKRAVVSCTPRAFTNRSDLFDRGGFIAVVDLLSGNVTRLTVTVGLAYVDPGCGASRTAIVTEASADGRSEKTQFQAVDATTAKIVRTGAVDSRATSAVPVGKDVIAAAGRVSRVRDTAGGADGSMEISSLPPGPRG